MQRGASSGRGEARNCGRVARFAEWRRIRQPGMRVPVELWELALKLARRLRASRTLPAILVGYSALQEHVVAAGLIKNETKSVSLKSRIVSQVTLSSGNRPTLVELPAISFHTAVESSV